MNAYPIFVNLEGRPCLVVGGGAVAFAKARGLHESGGRLTVVSPEFVAAFDSISPLERRVRPFEEGDPDGFFLAVAATDDPAVNRAVAEACRRRGVLCNVVDAPELCDFWVPSVLRRGDLTVAVSTGGASPALAKRVRRDLEGRFGEVYGEYVGFLREAREEARRRLPAREDRERLAALLASEDGYERFRGDGPEGRARWLAALIAELQRGEDDRP
jgi:precorrin-2 dehydrogenase/sirohydrochlorin ferrochelatase